MSAFRGVTVARCIYRTPEALATAQQAALRALVEMGAHVVSTENPDLVIARNVALTAALDREAEVVLCIDDDIGFNVQDALDLVQECKRTGAAVSARYARADGSLVAERWSERVDVRSGERWLTGLGFIAIPWDRLRQLSQASRVFDQGPGSRPAYLLAMPELYRTLEAPDGPLHWRPEDYALAARLGGVLLSALTVAHWKDGHFVYPKAAA